MSILDELIGELQAIERELQEQPALARRVHAVAATLEGEPGRWIDVETARRLADVATEEMIHAWVRAGLLRSRQGPDDEMQVSLADVLQEQRISEDLEGLGETGELSLEELDWLGKVSQQKHDTVAAS